MAVRAPVQALVSQILVRAGDNVVKGQPLLSLSVMKMQQAVASKFSGIIGEILVSPGEIVKKGQLLLSLKINHKAQSTASPPQQPLQTKNQAPSTSEGWYKEMEEIVKRQKLAASLGGPEAVERQRKAGKLTARERIDALLDEGSFVEVGSITSKPVYSADGSLESVVPSNCIGGTGKLDEELVVVSVDDFTIRGGHADGGIMFKSAYIEALARTLQIPMIRLLDGSSGGGSVATLLDLGATYVPILPGFADVVTLLSNVPVATAVLGPVVGLGAARSQMAHFSVVVKNLGQLFVAGPPLVEYATHEKVTKEELGGWEVCSGNGSIDNVAETEVEAFEMIKRWLSYLPANTSLIPPKRPCEDDPNREEEGLMTAVPKDRKASYDMRYILQSIVDKDTFFEIGTNWGQSVITGLARVNGYSIGIIASDPNYLAGSLSSASCSKLSRHLKFCSTFHLPVLNLVDCPGFLIGKIAEDEATIRKGAELLSVVYDKEKNSPTYTVIIRKCFGVGGAAMVLSDVRVAWPSGDWGSLPFEGGIEAGFSKMLKNSGNNFKEMRESLENKLESVRSPVRTAELFGIPEIIDPRKTRRRVCNWVKVIYSNVLPARALSKTAAKL